MRNIYRIVLAASLGAVTTLSACKKDFLDTKPTDQVATVDVFKDIAGAEAALQGIHRMVYEISGHDEFGYPSIALLFDLMGEDMSFSAPGSGWFINAYRLIDSRAPEGTGSYVWTYFYRVINNANYILANIDEIATDDQARRDFVKAGASFYRAWAYYNLANCYMFTYAGSSTSTLVPKPGEEGFVPVASFKEAACVPIYTTPTTADNKEGNARASVQQVYDLITSDLNTAVSLLENNSIPRRNKSEINVNVAKGLYARVALVMQNWALAETMAHDARQGYDFATGTAVNDGFTDARNSEWIWGSVINAEQSGIWASYLSHMDYDLQLYANGAEKRINSQLYNNEIDTTDLRRDWWISREVKRTGVPYATFGQRKFRAPNLSTTAGDFPLMRASEMALVEAEAMAMQGKVSQAANVLNEFVRTRQASFDASGLSAKNLVLEIWLQRRIELWGEGFRYFDLQRSFASFPVDVQNTVGMQRTSGQGHNSGLAVEMSVPQWGVQYLFRIPGGERIQNPKVVQNP
jgi:hypothetical protein